MASVSVALPRRIEGAPILKVEDVRVTFPVQVKDGSHLRQKQAAARRGWRELLAARGRDARHRRRKRLRQVHVGARRVQLLPRNAGEVTFLGRNLLPSEREAIRKSRKDLQIVFQDPLASLDPRMTLGASIAEPLLAFEPLLTREQREERVKEMMRQVGLDPDLINRYPHELSGGQNQRVGVARAMILKPKLVVCDEAVSALDVSIQAQILAAARGLAARVQTSFLFISHDLAVVREISHNVLVLYLGRAVEYGPAEVILRDPRHPYTKALLAAAPTPDPDARATSRACAWSAICRARSIRARRCASSSRASSTIRTRCNTARNGSKSALAISWPSMTSPIARDNPRRMNRRPWPVGRFDDLQPGGEFPTGYAWIIQ
jgi:ABC-type microcin C transport system duplicated ATPase subunit YejF